MTAAAARGAPAGGADAVLRPATVDDVPGILEIYNEVIVTSAAIYEDAPVALAERRAWFDARVAAGFPVLVAEDADGIAGYASFGPFRPMPGFRHTVEHSVHVRADRRGRGLGRRLLAALLPIAADMRLHVMLGAIDGANEASLRLHRSLGFEPVARFPEIGRKFETWRDVIIVHRFIDAPGAPRG